MNRKSKIKKGDTVIVVTGRERGKIGKVLTVQPLEEKITVEKLNIVKRHTKPTPKNRQGGILEREAPFSISNVMLYSENLHLASRVSLKVLEGGRKVRVLKKSPEEILDKV